MALAPASRQARHRGRDVLAGLRDRLLGHDLDAFEARRPTEVLEVLGPDVGTLVQHPRRRLAESGHEVRPEDRLIGHGAVREQEGPLPQPVLRAADADGGHPELALDLGTYRHRVVADVRPDDGDAACVDEFAERVDDRLGVAPGQTLRALVDDLHRPVDQARLQALSEDQLERLREIGQVVHRLAVADVVHEEPDLDRLGLTHRVRHQDALLELLGRRTLRVRPLGKYLLHILSERPGSDHESKTTSSWRGTCGSAASRGREARRQHDVLELDVGLESLRSELAPDARVLEATGGEHRSRASDR